MKKITKAFTIIGLAAILVALPSCKKSFLEEPPRAQTPDDYFSSTKQAAEELVTSVYNKLYDWSQHSFSWIGISSIASDDADKGSDPGDTGADKDQLDNLSFTSTSLSFSEVWESNYEGISRANKAIYLMDKLNMDASQRQIFKGEVQFLRAYYYFNLVRCFGGVPKIDKVPITQAEIDAVNVKSSADEIYDLIESDLSYAGSVLPSTRLIDQGRATSYAAIGLLAKVNLYREKWAQAAANAEVLIGSKNFDLLSDYSHIWREIGEFSSESIFEVNAKGTEPAKGIVGYFVVQAPRGQGGLGWGFNTPTLDLYNTYEAGDV
ncbi:MAG: RagB/SusD family nutrient uptake outer membrane protein, partial [Crocinitomicaceae bacterium]|nr:RagB/SusD family nutrient uptake outer membrane protein [Crocinitomicaceae bacterium]